MSNKILITGATGSLGSKVVNILKEKTKIENIAVLVRDEKNELAKQYANDGIDVRIGDYANLESLESSFKGIDTLYFVSGGDDNERAKLHKNVVDSAKKQVLSTFYIQVLCGKTKVILRHWQILLILIYKLKIVLKHQELLIQF